MEKNKIKEDLMAFEARKSWMGIGEKTGGIGLEPSVNVTIGTIEIY